MTEERRKDLDEFRQRALEIDAGRTEDGRLVDGAQKIEEALAAPDQTNDKMAQLVGARGRGAGKQKAARR